MDQNKFKKTHETKNTHTHKLLWKKVITIVFGHIERSNIHWGLSESEGWEEVESGKITNGY